ncbi:MFS transporter [Mucilaginibacter sp. UC70_90]
MIHAGLSEASLYAGFLTLAYSVMQFLFSPMIGNLSDKYGRRPVLLCSLLGFGIDYLFLAFAPSIWWLFLGRAIAGITGASFTTASAYIADVSTPEKRAQNFGMIGVAFGLGFIIGPAIGGVLGKMDVQYPFFAAAGLAFLNAIYGFFILPNHWMTPIAVPSILNGRTHWVHCCSLKNTLQLWVWHYHCSWYILPGRPYKTFGHISLSKNLNGVRIPLAILLPL